MSTKVTVAVAAILAIGILAMVLSGQGSTDPTSSGASPGTEMDGQPVASEKGAVAQENAGEATKAETEDEAASNLIGSATLPSSRSGSEIERDARMAGSQPANAAAQDGANRAKATVVKDASAPPEADSPTTTTNSQPAVSGNDTAKPASARKARRTEVRNEVTFTVPREFQREMGLTTAALTATDGGLVKVPNASIQDLNGVVAVFISLENDQFGLRVIEVEQNEGEYSLVESNVLEDEMVVTEGSGMLKMGLLRSMGGRGHSHGPGGHSH